MSKKTDKITGIDKTRSECDCFPASSGKRK